jgi:hypothetical protein
MEANKIPHIDIEKYLLGEMKQPEALAFEERMAGNDLLKQEVGFQREIIKGIGEARKLELKARLAQIPVSTSLVSTLLNSTWVKVTTGVVVVSTASILTYMQLDNQDSEPEVFIDTIDAPAISESVDLVIPDKDDKDEAEVKNPVPALVVKKEKKTIENQQDDAPEIFVPEVEIPEFEDNWTESDNEVDPQPTFIEEENNTSISVEQYPGDRMYRYFDGILTLRGDFDNVTYQLLELNNNEGKQFFIHVEDVYYSLPVTDTFVSFVRISDRGLIKELDLLKSSN